VIALLAVVAQLAIVAHAPDTASVCDPFEVSVAVSVAGNTPPTLVAPDLSPFEILRASPVPHVTRNAARGSMMAEYRLILATGRPGTYTIPAFIAHTARGDIRSQPLHITVRNGPRSGSVPSVIARARIDTGLSIDVRALTPPETVYVGQQANYEVAVFLNGAVRDRLRRNPTFFPPDMQSMLAYDLPADGDATSREIGSGCFEALVYRRALFPLMPGRFAIPPAQLVYSLPLSASFFSREETHELETDSTVIVAVPPPVASRPADYGGAVGDLRISARLDTSHSRVGDPVLLTLSVAGEGNVKLFPRPAVRVPWATLVPGQERVRVDTTAQRVRGRKEFDWVLTPKVAGELDLPPVKYSFFNPEARRYEVTRTTPEHLRVSAGGLASADTARTQHLLAIRARYRGVPRAPLHEHPIFWALLVIAPLPALTLSRRRGAAARLPVRLTPERSLANAVRAERPDPCAVRRTFTSAMADRLGLDAESFTRVGGLSRALRRRGVSTTVALDAEAFLRDLDEAAFTANGAISRESALRALVLYAAVDAEALARSDLRSKALLLSALIVASAGALHAGSVDQARQRFDKGVAAYQQHVVPAAVAAFRTAVQIEPAAPDAWANLGTADWSAGDTAHAVAAWQRALRSEPLAQDMRERAQYVHALPASAAGYVPPVAPWWVFDLAAVLWLGACGWATYRLVKKRNVNVRSVGAAGVAALVLVVAGLALRERLSGRGLAVVRATQPVNAVPALGGGTGPTAIIGEVVHVRGVQGAWSRVVLDDGRDGWLSTSALLSLDSREGSAAAN
jgi:hypothetical protein